MSKPLYPLCRAGIGDPVTSGPAGIRDYDVSVFELRAVALEVRLRNTVIT